MAARRARKRRIVNPHAAAIPCDGLSVSLDVRGQHFASGVSDDARSFASSLTLPYCGVNNGFEASRWLPDPATVMSLALIPLRAGAAGPAFGLLILASPDSQRYQAGMATDFLERIAELASAALSRVRDD